jgi:hypothetical protein
MTNIPSDICATKRASIRVFVNLLLLLDCCEIEKLQSQSNRLRQTYFDMLLQFLAHFLPGISFLVSCQEYDQKGMDNTIHKKLFYSGNCGNYSEFVS